MQGEEFKQRAREYIHNGIIRGIPSIFSDVKGLYTDVAKQEAIEEIVEDFKNTYAAERSTYTANGHATPDSDSEPPTTYLWVLYFLAQHHSHLGRYPLALSIIDAALAHTPTLPELHLTRARLLKRAGDPTGAVKAVEEARRLDGQDRFLNTKSAKYLIRAGRVEEAQAILGLFTKVRAFARSCKALSILFSNRKMLSVRLPTSRRCNRCSTSWRKRIPKIDLASWVML